MVKLTTLSHGGGCGCKIAPDILSQAIRSTMGLTESDRLAVGCETSDDAAAYRLNDKQALLATTDFFTPIVDDAYDFGRIAAANAISDIYAMGAKPLLALNIIGMPISKLPAETVTEVLSGGADICRQAGIVIAGGHSIDSAEPIYGLSVIGTADFAHLKTNATAQDGDALILGKPLGIGVLASALRDGKLDDESYREMMHWTSKLNRLGERLGKLDAVHSMTDVTGFGLLGHLSEICAASGLGAEIHYRDVPFIEAAERLAQQGVATGASERNLKAYRSHLRTDERTGESMEGLEQWQRSLLADPQTNGGLLLSCAAASASEILALFHEECFDKARVIGYMRRGKPLIDIAV